MYATINLNLGLDLSRKRVFLKENIALVRKKYIEIESLRDTLETILTGGKNVGVCSFFRMSFLALSSVGQCENRVIQQ